MQIIKNIENYKKTSQPVYLTLGNFDGVHLGHQKLIKDCVDKAHANNGLAVAFIFDPHPSYFLSPYKAHRVLTNANKKGSLLEKLGIDILILDTFTPEISFWSPREFVEKVLVNNLLVKEVFVGFNYTFGHKGRGTPATLSKLGLEYGFTVNIVSPVIIKGNVVSSTLIRKALMDGNIEIAEKMLGYCLCGNEQTGTF